MDRETQRKIDEINASIPRHLVKNLLYTPQDEELMLQREKAQWELERIQNTDKNKMSTGEQKRQIDALQTFLRGTANTPSQKVNEKIAREIEEYIEGKIRCAIRTGKLDPADPREVEKFKRSITKQ